MAEKIAEDLGLILRMLNMINDHNIKHGWIFDVSDAIKLQTELETVNFNVQRAEYMGLVEIESKTSANGWTIKKITDLGHRFLQTKHGNAMRTQIFVVHGRDTVAETQVELFLRRLNLDPIILHRETHIGRQLLEKFQEEARRASFAVVLLTPDDEGGPVGEAQKKRARQNVILEFGYFIGILGTNRVAALYAPHVELPSDLIGLGYIPYDEKGNWKNDLAREMLSAGVDLDAALALGG